MTSISNRSIPVFIESANHEDYRCVHNGHSIPEGHFAFNYQTSLSDRELVEHHRSVFSDRPDCYSLPHAYKIEAVRVKLKQKAEAIIARQSNKTTQIFQKIIQNNPGTNAIKLVSVVNACQGENNRTLTVYGTVVAVPVISGDEQKA